MLKDWNSFFGSFNANSMRLRDPTQLKIRHRHVIETRKNIGETELAVFWNYYSKDK